MKALFEMERIFEEKDGKGKPRFLLAREGAGGTPL